ncbi:MAG TPA: RNA polymerase sigma factor [Usitatibacter sp.]|jgi:RNA polymerase sigma-70 factor (ECF subfamily)|nr:RNA polymerase sigma factor [Usitatibacter sp.]
MGPPEERRFLELLAGHRAILHKVAYGYCRDPEDRRDLVQEMAIELWRSFPRFDGRVLFTTWAYRVALNVAISHFRGERRRIRDTIPFDEVLDLGVDDPLLDTASDNMRVLRRLIDGLDALNRALILLYLDGNTAEEIAAILGISPANVTTRVNRVKNELQRGFASLEKPTEATA